jgi:hypothetical protein
MFPMRLRAGNSAVDSDSDSDSDYGSGTVNSHVQSFSHDDQEWGDPMVYDGEEEITLEQNEAVMIPVRRSVGTVPSWTGNEAVVVVYGSPIQVVPGIWETGKETGSVLVMNQSCSDCHIAIGDAVGVVVPVALQSRECSQCHCFDTDSWVLGSGSGCARCERPLTGGLSVCRACGSEEVSVLYYSGCEECAPSLFGPQCAQAAGAGIMSMRPTQGKTVCSAAAAAESLVASHSVKHAIYHIVEEPGGID